MKPLSRLRQALNIRIRITIHWPQHQSKTSTGGMSRSDHTDEHTQIPYGQLRTPVIPSVYSTTRKDSIAGQVIEISRNDSVGAQSWRDQQPWHDPYKHFTHHSSKLTAPGNAFMPTTPYDQDFDLEDNIIITEHNRIWLTECNGAEEKT